MSAIGRVFNKALRRPVADPLQETKLEVDEAISLCGLAGFRKSKIRRIILTIPGFDKLTKDPKYAQVDLEKAFEGLRGRRAPSHMQFLQTGLSAASLRSRALALYQQQVVDKGTFPPDTEGQVQEEVDRWIRCWTEEMRLLNVYEQRQLEIKFEGEFAGRRAATPERFAVMVADERDVKHAQNLESFERGQGERRASLKPLGFNNRLPITHTSLRSGYASSPKAASTEQFLTPPSKGWNGEGISRPGSAQSVDVEGYFATRPTA